MSFLLALVFTACIAPLVGCERVPRAASAPVPTVLPDAPEAQAAATRVRPGINIWRYTARGEVKSLPKATGIDRSLRIQHEALKAFYNREGGNVGMRTMTMDFPALAPDVSLVGVSVGNKVVFDFEVDWDSRDVWVVTRLVLLPAGTTLNFDPE